MFSVAIHKARLKTSHLSRHNIVYERNWVFVKMDGDIRQNYNLVIETEYPIICC